MHTVGPGIWQDNWKCGKWETHTVGREIWRRKQKKLKMRNVHSRTWNMARKMKIMENEKHPLNDLKNDEITEKREKWEMDTVGPGIWRENWKSRNMRNTHFRTWNLARKTEKGGKFEISTVGHGYGKKTENHGKWEIHTWGREIWRGKLKKVKNLEMSIVGHGIWQENCKWWKMRTFTWRLEKWRSHWKTWKMRNAHCRTWNMARKMKITKNEKYTI